MQSLFRYRLTLPFRQRRYDHENGVQSFQVSWTSKASAAQRAGRAGRTGPGHCYRLYSSALFETYFEKFSQPEILRTPIEGVVLQMKSMHIDAVVNFPFPTPPDRLSLKKAETVLTHLGALSVMEGPSVTGGEITDVGRAMSLFPLSPRFSRMLVSGRQHGCLPYVITIVSALSVGDPFLREEALGQEDESSEEEDEDLSHIRNEAVRAKEVRRLRRKAFFSSQEVCASVFSIGLLDYLLTAADPCFFGRPHERRLPDVVSRGRLRIRGRRTQVLC